MPKVSIIIPTYNVEKYLRECMDSVVNQTLQDIEIICVDDGAKDNSGKILDEYAQKDKRIKVIHKANGGYGKAMNVGLDNATGEYIGIVEPDDFVELNMYETLYNTAKEHDVDFVKGNYYGYFENNNKNDLKVTFDKKNVYNVIIKPLEHIETFRGGACIWSALYNHKFLTEKKIRFLETPGASFQDTSFWIRVLFEAKKALYIKDAHYHYRMDNPTSSVKDNSKIFCVCDELEFLDKLYSSDKYKRDIINSSKLEKYSWNYQRLGAEGKKEFAKKYCKDISNILKNKSYNAKFTSSAAIEMAKKNIAENNHPIFANIFSKKVKYKNGKKITRYLGGIIKKVKGEKSKKVYLFGVQIYHKHRKKHA
jgi:glycosyltransferase involved in cell wall biosynthesis